MTGRMPPLSLTASLRCGPVGFWQSIAITLEGTIPHELLARVIGGSATARRAPAQAQQATPCRVLCAPEFKVEPTITFTNLFGSPRTIADDGALTREPARDRVRIDPLARFADAPILVELHGRSDLPALRGTTARRSSSSKRMSSGCL